MKVRTIIMAWVLASLVGGLVLVNTAAADESTYPCTLAGYVYMGGMGFNINNAQYFIAGPMEYYYSGTDYWGFAFIKFDTIGTEEVEHAYLMIELLKVGSMHLEDASEGYPGEVDLYSPGDTDVADLSSAEDATTLHNTLKASSTPFVADYTMPANGAYTIEITDIYNAWVRGDQDNNGLILISESENSNSGGDNPGNNLGPVGTQYAGLDGSLGTAPYIAFSAPEEAPTVSATSPEAAATGVDVGTTVTISFDKTMDTESVENAFSMALSSDAASTVAGAFSWDDLGTELTYTPMDLLDHETAYAVTVGTDAADSNGNNLESAYTFSFTTRAYVAPEPEVTGTPEGTVDVDTVTLTISGDGVYAYCYSLDGADWSAAYDPSENLSLTDLTDGEHALVIQVKDSLDRWTTLETITWTVAAPPTIEAVTPEADGTAAVSDSIMVTFSEAMDQDSVRAAFSISPAVAGTLSWKGESTSLVFTPATFFASGTEYTITVAATAADLAGYALASSYSWSFTTLASSSVRCEASADTYVLHGGMGSGKGYPQGTSLGKYKLKAGAVSIVDARMLIRFDFSPITDLGLAAEDIESAYLVYAMLDNDGGMDVGPPAPDGTAMYGFIHVLDPESYEKYPDDPPDEAFYWTEAASGDGYVTMYNKPWYVEGSPWVLATHSTGSGTTGKVDIAALVKGFLDGRWENNGIELRDQDDGSWADSTTVYGAEYGDGYSWHIASREDTAQGPYLLVTYDEDKLRIKDHAASSAALTGGETVSLTAGGGDADSYDYQWTATGPAGEDSAASLSAATGDTVTFTAPDNAPGIYTVALACGDEEDSISIGVGTASSSSSRAPLYLNFSQSSLETPLVNICDNILDQMGRCDSLGRIFLVDGEGDDSIGGTGLDCDARVAIAVIDDLSATTTVSLDGFSGLKPSMTITSDSLPGVTGTVYAVIVDTGRDSFGGASNIYMFELFDADGTEITSAAINSLELTLPFDATATGSTSFENGTSTILYADTVGDFFAVDSQTTLDTDVEVYDDEGVVVFETTHLSVFGLSVDKGSGSVTAEASDSLGGGCFIGSLFPTASGERP